MIVFMRDYTYNIIKIRVEGSLYARNKNIGI